MKFNLTIHFKLSDHHWLFDCFEPQEQFFSYLAAVTITCNRAANLDQCLALTAFSSKGSFTCHTYCNTGPPFLRSHPKDLWFLFHDSHLAKEQSLPIFKNFKFDAAGIKSGARTHNLLDAKWELYHQATATGKSHHWSLIYDVKPSFPLYIINSTANMTSHISS
jgi:hypothetical protein